MATGETHRRASCSLNGRYVLAITPSGLRARFERSPLSTYTSLGSQDTFNEGVTNRVSSTCIEAILQQNLCILPLQKYLRRNVCKRNLKARTLLKRALKFVSFHMVV